MMDNEDFTTRAAAQYSLGIAAVLRGEPRASLPYLKAAIDLDTRRSDYWSAYCEALAACGETATALAVMEGARQQGYANGAMTKLAERLRLAAAPAVLQSLHAAALKDHAENRLSSAVTGYRKVLALHPDFAEAHVNLGSVLQAQGALEGAIMHYRRAIELRPDFAEAHFNLGNALGIQGEDPIPAYRAAVAARPGYAEAHYNLGIALEASGRPGDATAAYRAAIAARPTFAEAHVNLGVLLFSAGSLDDAIVAYDAALRAQPRFSAAYSNKGNALRAKGEPENAATAYKTAIAIQPGFAEAHNHLGNLLRAEGRLDDAIACYRDALEAKPAFAGALSNLGYTLAESGKIAEGFSILTRQARMLSAFGKAEPGPPHKRLHDQEQRAYLGPAKPDPLDPLWLEGGARLGGPALNRGNGTAAIDEKWNKGVPKLVVIDDFLTENALDALRRFCWGSTIWREVYDKGYLGAFPEHGVACPLLAQIAEELRDVYRGIFLNHPLLQLWAFKYESRLGGIPLHADFAAVNVNFWITPDDANLDKDRGGLVVWDVPAPLEWDFEKYNIDAAAGRNFLASKGARSVTVPHRANRAVIFDSDLFHETDRIDFRDGYTNRRINLTLLYGRRGA